MHFPGEYVVRGFHNDDHAYPDWSVPDLHVAIALWSPLKATPPSENKRFSLFAPPFGPANAEPFQVAAASAAPSSIFQAPEPSASIHPSSQPPSTPVSLFHLSEPSSFIFQSPPAPSQPASLFSLPNAPSSIFQSPQPSRATTATAASADVAFVSASPFFVSTARGAGASLVRAKVSNSTVTQAAATPVADAVEEFFNSFFPKEQPHPARASATINALPTTPPKLLFFKRTDTLEHNQRDPEEFLVHPLPAGHTDAVAASPCKKPTTTQTPAISRAEVLEMVISALDAAVTCAVLSVEAKTMLGKAISKASSQPLVYLM